MNRILAFFTLALASLAAQAFDYGRWMCNCNLDPLLASTNTVVPSPVEVIAFIRTTNPQITATGPNGPRWVPNDRITVCDGDLCLQVFYQASGIWLPIPPGTFKDTGRGYKNSSMNWNG